MAAKQDIRADTNDRSAVGAEAPPNDWAPAPSTSLFSLGRLLAVAGLTLRHGVRMNVWLLVPAAVFVLIVADLTSPRFDPVFERVPRTVEISLSAMIAVGILISIFLSTFTLPKEIETHTIYTVLTKPVSRLELIAGKAVGLSMLLAVCLGPMALVSWGYIHVRARQVRALAEAEYAERKATAPFPADLGALEHMRDRGPLTARKFINPAGRPEVRTLVPEPPWKWILGRSGEVLNWEFPEPAKPEIIGRGTTIRLFVKYRKLEGAGQEAPKLRVLIRYDLKVLRSLDPEQRQVLRNTVTRELDSDGRLEVGLTTLLQGPNRKGLDYIGHGPLNIAVVCDSEGVILGSTKDSCLITGPRGWQAMNPVRFTVATQSTRGKVWITGHSELPRQTAIFTFEDVPEHFLSPGPVPLEIAHSLKSYGTGDKKSEARVVLYNPATGQSRGPISFTPESRRSALLHIDPEFWHGGTLEVKIDSVTDGDQMGFVVGRADALSSVRLWGAPRAFALNFGASVLMIWAGATLVACIGTMVSARVSWFVSILFTAMVFIASSFRELMFATVSAGHGHGGAGAAGEGGGLSDVGAWLWSALGAAARFIFPDFSQIWPADFASQGVAMPWGPFASGIGLALIYSLVAIVLGWLLLKWREVDR